jgi:hypothetical protein
VESCAGSPLRRPFDDEEELILGFVPVPHKRALELDEFDVLAV